MARKDNAVLGVMPCLGGCGSVATIHQAARGKGRFFYTRCGECGCDQRNGKAVQQAIWDGAEWRPEKWPEGFELVPPSCVSTEKAEPKEPKKGTGAEPEEPARASVREPAKEPGEPSNGGGFKLLLAVGILVLTGGALWKI